MKENSIEEITFVENKIKNTRRVFEEVGCHVFFDEDLCKAIEHILSDYKRVLKENKELKKFITEGITIEPNSPYKNYQLDFLRKKFIPKTKIEEILEKTDLEIKKLLESE